MRKNELEPILEYAKKLYLMPDKNGNHKYSLQVIVDLIEKEFNKRFAKATVFLWSEKYGWKALWQEAVRKGITLALIEGAKETDKEIDEQYEELIATRKRDDFLKTTQLKEQAFEYIQKQGFISIADALKAIEIGMKYTESLAIDVIVKNDQAKQIEEAITELQKALMENKL